MKFKYSKIYYNNLTLAVVLVNSFITKAPGIGYVRQLFSNALNIDERLIVLASKTPNGNIEYIYGHEKVIKLIKNNEIQFVWEIYDGL